MTALWASVTDNDHLHEWGWEYTVGPCVEALVVSSEGLITSTTMASFTCQSTPITNTTFDDFINLPDGSGCTEPISAL